MKIQGAPDHPFTQGTLCTKVATTSSARIRPSA